MDLLIRHLLCILLLMGVSNYVSAQEIPKIDGFSLGEKLDGFVAKHPRQTVIVAEATSLSCGSATINFLEGKSRVIEGTTLTINDENIVASGDEIESAKKSLLQRGWEPLESWIHPSGDGNYVIKLFSYRKQRYAVLLTCSVKIDSSPSAGVVNHIFLRDEGVFFPFREERFQGLDKADDS